MIEKDATGSLFAPVQNKPGMNALPVAVAIIGASVMFMALLLFANEKGIAKDNGNHEVENYDVVGNMPFIFSAVE